LLKNNNVDVSLSLDVSTGEHDSDNRLFASPLYDVIMNGDEVVMVFCDPEPNFIEENIGFNSKASTVDPDTLVGDDPECTEKALKAVASHMESLDHDDVIFNYLAEKGLFVKGTPEKSIYGTAACPKCGNEITYHQSSTNGHRVVELDKCTCVFYTTIQE